MATCWARRRGGSADFAAPGTAQGFNAEKAPILVSAGIDTTVAVPVSGGVDSVDIYKFAVYRGECDAFKDAGSADPTNPHVADIRNNYGLDCRGGQAPVSPTSTYQASAKLSYTYGTGSRAALSFLRNQLNSRNFSYSRMFGAAVDFDALYTGNNVATLNITQNLSKSAERALALDVYAIVPVGPGDRGSAHDEQRERHPESVGRVHRQADGLPVQLRQLPDRPGAGCGTSSATRAGGRPTTWTTLRSTN